MNRRADNRIVACARDDMLRNVLFSLLPQFIPELSRSSPTVHILIIQANSRQFCLKSVSCGALIWY
jgi:hypothetical protein